MSHVEHIAGHTWHGRKGAIENAFRYSVDYVLFDPECVSSGPGLFSHNRRNLAAVFDCDHGGPVKNGKGVVWVRDVLAAHDLECNGQILLLAQPRMAGHVFNPVSFWLCHDDADQLRVVIAEVTNTFGDRHSYLCVKPDHSRITSDDRLQASKVFHVSPFQPVDGSYEFRFAVTPDKIDIRIVFDAGKNGVVATLTGARIPLTNRGLMWAALRRPFGSRRVLTLIYWQALKLKLKGAMYRPRPTPPKADVSR